MKPLKTIYIAAGLMALLGAMAMIWFMNSFQGALLSGNPLSNASPIGIIAVFAIIVFAGVYFFNSAGKIIKEAIK